MYTIAADGQLIKLTVTNAAAAILAKTAATVEFSELLCHKVFFFAAKAKPMT